MTKVPFEGSGQSRFCGARFDDLVEDLRERVLELVSTDETVRDLVSDEVMARFPKGVPSEQPETLDEVVCMCQLLVFDRILKGIVR